MEDVEMVSYCSWHCFCKPLLCKTQVIRIITPASEKRKGVRISTTQPRLLESPSPRKDCQGLTKGDGNIKLKELPLPPLYLLPGRRCPSDNLSTRHLWLGNESLLKSEEDSMSSLNSENLQQDSVLEDQEQEHPVTIEALHSVSSPFRTVEAATNNFTLQVKTEKNGEDTSACEAEASQSNEIISSMATVEFGMEADIIMKQNRKIKKEPGTSLTSKVSSSSVSSAPSSVYNCRNRSQFHKCGTCGKMFGQLKSLKMHEKEHLLETFKNCECVECGKSYTTLASYQRHLKSHTKCLLCGKGISKAQKNRLAAGSGLDVNVCSRCKKNDLHSPRKRKLQASLFGKGNDHSDSESNDFDEGSMPGTDEGDEEDYSRVLVKNEELSSMHSHNSSHKKLELDYSCRYCGESYPTSALMKKHESLIHMAERPFKCSFCPDRFKENHHKTRHELTHSGANTHVCLICQAVFNQDYRLKNHLVKYHIVDEDD